eukprot:1194368-Prorocentrum_minimum.AAC.11
MIITGALLTQLDGRDVNHGRATLPGGAVRVVRAGVRQRVAIDEHRAAGLRHVGEEHEPGGRERPA